MMTKKDIVAIADVIKGLATYRDMDDCQVVDIKEVIENFSDMLEKQNPQFKRQLFMDYIAGKVGPNGGKN